MAVLKELQRILYIIGLLIIHLVCWLGCLSSAALAQLEVDEIVTGSATFPVLGITCIGNLVVFITSLIRGRLDIEMAARDVVATIRGPQLKDINGFGVATCREFRHASVVMLSNHKPHSSTRQFMKYISSAHGVDSILLQFHPFHSAEICNCSAACRCIVFETVDEITMLLACRMPGTVKRLSDSLCLLPSLNCLRNGCHGCNQGLLHVETSDFGRETLTEGDSITVTGESPAAVCRSLDMFQRSIQEKRACICIPVHAAGDDEWTKLLIRCFRSKDVEDRRVQIMAFEALENYLAHSRGDSVGKIEYISASLIVPRLTEVLINLVLTTWLRVDGFSSSLVARRAIREYLVDAKGTGFAANTFLTKALVNSNADNTHVCQVLYFRGTLLSLRTMSFIVGGVNLICSISWAMLIAVEGGPGKWYDIQSMPPSKGRVGVILAAIGIALGMDCLHVYLNRREGVSWRIGWRKIPMLWAVIVLEVLCIVSGSTVAGLWGVKVFGRWVYSAMHGLVWIKWAIGTYLLGEYSQDYALDDSSLEYDSRQPWWTDRGGILVYSTAFFLNAILAGVRGKWVYFSSN